MCVLAARRRIAARPRRRCRTGSSSLLCGSPKSALSVVSPGEYFHSSDSSRGPTDRGAAPTALPGCVSWRQRDERRRAAGLELTALVAPVAGLVVRRRRIPRGSSPSIAPLPQCARKPPHTPPTQRSLMLQTLASSHGVSSGSKAFAGTGGAEPGALLRRRRSHRRRPGTRPPRRRSRRRDKRRRHRRRSRPRRSHQPRRDRSRCSWRRPDSRRSTRCSSRRRRRRRRWRGRRVGGAKASARTGVRDAVAGLGGIADVRADDATDGRALGIRRAGGGRPGAVLDEIADAAARRGTSCSRARRHWPGRHRRPRRRSRRRRKRRRHRDRARCSWRRPGSVSTPSQLSARSQTPAAARQSAVLLASAGHVGARAGAVLGEIADAGAARGSRRSTARSHRPDSRCSTPSQTLGGVADAGGGAAHRGALGIGGTRGGRSGAVFDEVADAGGAAALDARGHEGRPGSRR